MNRRMLLALILIVLALTITAAGRKCIDTDGGRNPFIEGYVARPNGRIYADVCVDARIVREYYCIKNRCGSYLYRCEDGCWDGYCLPAIPEWPSN